MENQNTAAVTVAPLSLPKGNGTISGMGETLGGISQDGMLSLSLPFPLSPGRGDVPALSLNYHSGAGNGPFGMGWSCPVMSVARRTARGFPRWQDNDEFTGPDGEVLVPASASERRTTLRGQSLPECLVTSYRPRTERHQYVIERWQPVNHVADTFWIILTPDGGLHCLGKTAQARVADPQTSDAVAVWLLEESVNIRGEHQYWQYHAENNTGCDAQESAEHPQAGAQRYLSRVFYGNITPSDLPFVLNTPPVQVADWLFCVGFDYGDYGSGPAPAFEPVADWAVRQDRFSDYRYGFEIRTRRLCRRVLMYQRVKQLQGDSELSTEMSLSGSLRFIYDESPVLTTLVAALREGAPAADGEQASLPPLEFDWQEPAGSAGAQWLPVTDLANLNPLQSWQMVDLYGEGVPGILYRDEQAWWYCSPLGDSTGGITWSVPAPLPVTPFPAGHALLMDLTHSGKPDWIVTQPGIQGYFTLSPDNSWSSFIPLAALPTEFFHSSAQLQDLTGDGDPDLVLIGPGSVRLWQANDACWTPAQTVDSAGPVPLPVAGRNARRAVIFSDVLGSGQQHLVEIGADGVTVWPTLGYGRFGDARKLPGFSVLAEEFSPSRLYLADTDGSGANDILYVESDRIRIFLNESGNRFTETAPVRFPDGVRFDDSCQLQMADLQGLGVTDILLTLTHPQVQHWCCHLNTSRPWLLSAMNNNMGTHHTFTYRSSVHYWLEEKKQAPDAVCHLPFPVHTLWKHTAADEITGNRLTSEARYYQGVWDAQERELRGFARVEQRDTTLTPATETDTPPLLIRNWYATGVENIDSQLFSQYWQDDTHHLAFYTPKLTVWQNNSDQPLPAQDDRWWLQRAFRGCLLRSESYGQDGSAQQGIPYTVSESRWQARRLSQASGVSPVVMVMPLESRSYHYERIIADPVISQSVNLKLNAEGLPVDILSISYPRRPAVSSADYPATLQPVSVVSDSLDDQQQNIYLSRVRARFFTVMAADTGGWLMGVADEQRNDVCQLPADRSPTAGFCHENLTGPGGIMATKEAQENADTWYEKGVWTFAGKQKIRYTTSQGDNPLTGAPTVQALVAFTETAVLDNTVFSLTQAVTLTEKMLTDWGYFRMVDAVTADTNAPVTIWGARQGYTDYGGQAQFWRPEAQRATLLTGKNRIHWDKHHCLPTGMTDAAGLTTTLTQVDYRFMLPVMMKDINDNQHQIIADSFGRPVGSRFSGTEGGNPVPTGYSDLASVPFTVPKNVTEALALTGRIPLASFSVIAVDSWMKPVGTAPLLMNGAQLKTTLSAAGVISPDDRLYVLAWQRYLRRHQTDADVLALNLWLGQQKNRLPPHQLDVMTDRYDRGEGSELQQHRQTVRFSDGMGRPVQVAVRHENGIPEWLWTPGGLTKSDGKTSDTRWAVSGRTEYNNKGLPVRTYQPFFLNDWRYVSDDSARQDLYADTLFYDATGRHIRTRTAKGYLRRTGYYPWFTVSEDENDTAEEVSALPG